MPKVAKALILDARGNALILRRSSTHPYYAFEPDLPGGIVEKNESHEEGLCREISEETGLQVVPGQLRLAEITNAFGTKNKELFIAQLDEIMPAVTISWEHDQYSWVEPRQLLGRLQGHDPFLEVAREYLETQI